MVPVSVSFPIMINLFQDMTLLFEEKRLTKETYLDDSHPLYIYLQGDVQTRCEVILNHHDVIGFVYVNEDIVTKAFLPKNCQLQIYTRA